jgi:uncharacterized protein YbjT (DUF2867 family)
MFGANTRRILVTGGGTFLGDHIAAALLAEGADVTLLVRPGNESRLGVLAQRVNWRVADVWDTASLRGRGRGHGLAIHTVGSMTADPTQGLSYNRLNFVSARNVATMCVSDGVPHLMLISSASAPWLNRQYIRSKREAEQYLGRVGVKGTVIRAPLAYVRGTPRPLFFEMMTFFGSVPPFSLALRNIAPMPVDVLARGVARLALDSQRSKSVYSARDLRRLNSRQELTGNAPLESMSAPLSQPEAQPHPFDLLDEDTPFGWAPPEEPR